MGQTYVCLAVSRETGWKRFEAIAHRLIQNSVKFLKSRVPEESAFGVVAALFPRHVHAKKPHVHRRGRGSGWRILVQGSTSTVGQ